MRLPGIEPATCPTCKDTTRSQYRYRCIGERPWSMNPTNTPRSWEQQILNNEKMRIIKIDVHRKQATITLNYSSHSLNKLPVNILVTRSFMCINFHWYTYTQFDQYHAGDSTRRARTNSYEKVRRAFPYPKISPRIPSRWKRTNRTFCCGRASPWRSIRKSDQIRIWKPAERCSNDNYCTLFLTYPSST